MEQEINGLFDDDGTPINPHSIPIPGLCLICKKYHEEDWEENILCSLNRWDQKDEEEFECWSFEKKEPG